MAVPDFIQRIEINAAPMDVWQAIVDPGKVVQYHLAPLREIRLIKGGGIIYGTEGEDLIVGKIVDADIGKRLTHTFRFQPNHEGTRDDPETTVSYVIAGAGDGARLTLTHSGFAQENQTYANISGGWPYILDRLKAFLEKK